MLGQRYLPDRSGKPTVGTDPEPWVNLNDPAGGAFDAGTEVPEHALKFYKTDQQFKYLLVHQETRAEDVVKLALLEFGISEMKSNYSLYKVTVKDKNVMTQRQPDGQTNLAERIGLSSRYYIKNNMATEACLPDDAQAELSKESTVHLLDLNPNAVAAQLLVEDFNIFRQIEMTEYVEKLFELATTYGHPNLTKFGELVNDEMWWVVTEIVSEQNVGKRIKLMKQFIKIAHHCYKDTQNYNSMFAITCGLNHSAVMRLKNSRQRLPPKYAKLLEELTQVIVPDRNFSRYRNLISNATPPMIPIYPMVNKDLTFIHLGNETKVDFLGKKAKDGLINFEKLRMVAKEVRGLMNMCSGQDIFRMLENRQSGEPFNVETLRVFNSGAAKEKGGILKTAGPKAKARENLNPRRMHDEAQMVRRVKAYLAQRQIIKNEEELKKLSQKCEPDPERSKQSMTTHPSTTSVASTVEKLENFRKNHHVRQTIYEF